LRLKKAQESHCVKEGQKRSSKPRVTSAFKRALDFNSRSLKTEL